MADLQLRTVRYYIQIRLVDRPQGSTRAAAYGTKHLELEQLLLIKKWTTAGVSLDRIRALLQGADAPVPPRPVRSGQIEVKSHILMTDGLEVVIDPSRAGLTTDEVRDFVKGVMAAYESVIKKKRFMEWVAKPNPQRPYQSFGNDSAMRVSPCAWLAGSLNEVPPPFHHHGRYTVS